MRRPRVYDYECQKCGEWVEMCVGFDERDEPTVHRHADDKSSCIGVLLRGFRPGGRAPAKVSEGYEMKGVVYQGEKKIGHVAGNFGRPAPKRRRRF